MSLPTSGRRRSGRLTAGHTKLVRVPNPRVTVHFTVVDGSSLLPSSLREIVRFYSTHKSNSRLPVPRVVDLEAVLVTPSHTLHKILGPENQRRLRFMMTYSVSVGEQTSLMFAFTSL